MRFSRLPFVLSVLAFLCSEPHLRGDPQVGDRHKTTAWDLRPSLTLDALCLLNALSGDPYYLEYYRAEYDHFDPLFTPEERDAFRKLKTIIKDGDSDIISAKMALYFSATGDETLDQLVETAHDSSKMRAALMKTTYWSDDGWAVYEKARPHLEMALRALRRVGLGPYWETTARPRIEHRISELAPELSKYNVIPAIEAKLGKPLSSNRIAVYLLAYSEPHGIKITGTQFITHVSYPFRIVLRNAVHEMMHPPYDASDPKVASAIADIGRDPLIHDKVTNHDKSFGYNTIEGYVEEDSVEALEEIVCEEFGLERDAREYWKTHDDGIHVLAAAIYAGYKQVLHDRKEEISYPEWFVRAVRNGELHASKLTEATGQPLAAQGKGP
jgi:hypothetical protein